MTKAYRWYSDEELEFLRIGYRTMSLADLVVAFNKKFNSDRTAQKIKATLGNYGFRKGIKKPVDYTEEQISFLKTNYKTMSAKKLTVAFNARFAPQRSVSSIQGILLRSGARKFGHKAARAYTKEQVQFLREGHLTMPVTELVEAFNRQFGTNKTFAAITYILKSRKIRKYKVKSHEIGEEIICPAHGYRLVKTEKPTGKGRMKRLYRYKHVMVWEEANGPVPEGKYVRFVDGDKTNCTLGNLALVSAVEHGLLNQMDLTNLHPDLRATAIDTARLQAKCIELEKANR